jgi:hypothetical protein
VPAIKIGGIMNEQNLKNCPFCGGESIFITLAPCHGYIACIGDCRFNSGDFWDEPMTEGENDRTKWNEIAAKAWNRRHIDG